MQQDKAEISGRTPENRTRRITRNTLFLYGSEAAARLFSWATLAFLWRHWPSGTYGQYALAVNWASILAIFGELGLNVLVVREVAHKKEQAIFYLRNATFLRLAFSLAILAALIGIGSAFHYEAILRVGLAIMGIRILVDSASGGYIYLLQAHEQMGFFSFTNILSAAIRLLGIVLVLLGGGGVLGACWIWVVASVAAFLALSLKAHRQGWKHRFSELKPGESLSVLKQSLPFAAFGAFQQLYYRVDSIILKGLSGNEAVGFYDAASKILFVVLTLSQIYGMAVFPVFSSLRDNGEEFNRLAMRSLKFLYFLAVPITVGGFLLAGPLVRLVSGDNYMPSGPLFAVLALSIFPYFISNFYSTILAVKSAKRLNLQFFFLFTLNILLNFLLIPRIGTVGASWATVLCEFFGLGLGFYLARPYLRRIDWRSLARPAWAALLSAALMGAGVWFSPRLYWLGLGPLVYGAGLFLFKGLEREDREALRLILRKSDAARPENKPGIFPKNGIL